MNKFKKGDRVYPLNSYYNKEHEYRFIEYSVNMQFMYLRVYRGSQVIINSYFVETLDFTSDESINYVKLEE